MNRSIVCQDSCNNFEIVSKEEILSSSIITSIDITTSKTTKSCYNTVGRDKCFINDNNNSSNKIFTTSSFKAAAATTTVKVTKKLITSNNCSGLQTIHGHNKEVSIHNRAMTCRPVSSSRLLTRRNKRFVLLPSCNENTNDHPSQLVQLEKQQQSHELLVKFGSYDYHKNNNNNSNKKNDDANVNIPVVLLLSTETSKTIETQPYGMIPIILSWAASCSSMSTSSCHTKKDINDKSTNNTECYNLLHEHYVAIDSNKENFQENLQTVQVVENESNEQQQQQQQLFALQHKFRKERKRMIYKKQQKQLQDLSQLNNTSLQCIQQEKNHLSILRPKRKPKKIRWHDSCSCSTTSNSIFNIEYNDSDNHIQSNQRQVQTHDTLTTTPTKHHSFNSNTKPKYSSSTSQQQQQSNDIQNNFIAVKGTSEIVAVSPNVCVHSVSSILSKSNKNNNNNNNINFPSKLVLFNSICLSPLTHIQPLSLNDLQMPGQLQIVQQQKQQQVQHTMPAQSTLTRSTITNNNNNKNSINDEYDKHCTATNQYQQIDLLVLPRQQSDKACDEQELSVQQLIDQLEYNVLRKIIVLKKYDRELNKWKEKIDIVQNENMILRKDIVHCIMQQQTLIKQIQIPMNMINSCSNTTPILHSSILLDCTTATAANTTNNVCNGRRCRTTTSTVRRKKQSILPITPTTISKQSDTSIVVSLSLSSLPQNIDHIIHELECQLETLTMQNIMYKSR